MRLTPWQLGLGGLLAALSAGLYLLMYFLFQTPRNIVYYFFQDLAFLPIEVLLVTLILHRVLSRRERRARLHKMNMVIGAFFNEAGTGLIERYFPFMADPETPGKFLQVRTNWTARQFDEAAAAIRKHDFGMDSRRGDLEELKRYLDERKDFLLRLLENPNLLEHDTFTDLLWAVFHLTDELAHRPSTRLLPEADYDHLTIDLRRAFSLLLVEWLAYMNHLKRGYPYLFNLAVRTNPFDPNASAIIR